MFRIGVIGYGSRLNSFISTVDMVGGAELVAVTDVVDKKEYLEENGHFGVKQYTDAEEMINNERLDGICIGTRCSLHAAYMSKIAKYGIPIFLEKPVAINDRDLELLRGLKEINDKVVVSFPLRVSKITEYVKRILDSGELGEICQVQAFNNVPYARGYYHKWYRDDSITGDLFLQKATHDIDYISYLIGEKKPVNICAMSSKMYYKGDNPENKKCKDCDKRFTCEESIENLKKLDPAYGDNYKGDLMCCFATDTGNQDSGSFIVKYDCGMHVNYTQDFVAKYGAGRRGARIICTFGTVEFDFYTNVVKVYKHLENVTAEHKLTIGGDHFGGDEMLARNFIGVMAGTEKSNTPLSAGILSAQICLLAEKSATNNKFYDIPCV